MGAPRLPAVATVVPQAAPAPITLPALPLPLVPKRKMFTASVGCRNASGAFVQMPAEIAEIGTSGTVTQASGPDDDEIIGETLVITGPPGFKNAWQVEVRRRRELQRKKDQAAKPQVQQQHHSQHVKPLTSVPIRTPALQSR